MKKLIICLTLATFATLSLRAGETTTKSASCDTDSCCAAKSKVSKRVAPTVKGAEALVLMAKR